VACAVGGSDAPATSCRSSAGEGGRCCEVDRLTGTVSLAEKKLWHLALTKGCSFLWRPTPVADSSVNAVRKSSSFVHMSSIDATTTISMGWSFSLMRSTMAAAGSAFFLNNVWMGAPASPAPGARRPARRGTSMGIAALVDPRCA